jgi:hypothetical protein
MADISQRLAHLRPYLVEPRCAVLTTLARDGSPAAAVEDAMAIARRYGEDPAAYRDQARISFRIVPRHIDEYTG